MSEQSHTPKGKPFNLENHIEYAAGSVVSKTLIKKEIGTITLFAFDRGQGLSEHTAPFDAVVHILDGNSRNHHRWKTSNRKCRRNVDHALQTYLTPFKPSSASRCCWS